MIVLCGADLKEGIAVGECVRASIEAAAIRHGESFVGPVVSVSIGVACTVPSNLVSADELISSADTALYVAKRSGRNQVQPPCLKATAAVGATQAA